MILRKPYAFLIKNFRKIHFLLSIFMIFVAYESSLLSAFFNNYINTGSHTPVADLAGAYINVYFYLGIIFIIFITTIVYILMTQKNKPTLLYLIVEIFYIAFIIYLFQAAKTLDVIQYGTLDPQTARIYRDISSVALIAQYAVIIFMLVRAVGFDIRRFNFGEDLQQLQIEASDNEEFELTVGVDTRRIKRGFIHQLREIKYFVIENMFIFLIIISIFVIVVGLGLYLNFEVYNKIYREGIKVESNNFIINVNKSYYTDYNYRGDKITTAGKSYVIVNMGFDNININNQTLYLGDINLITNKNVYKALDNQYSPFFDLGIGYKGQKTGNGQTNNFIFVFEVGKNEIDVNNMILRYTDSLYNKDQMIKGNYKKIKLRPISLDSKTIFKGVKIGEKLLFNQSLLMNSSIQINSFDFNSRYTYQTKSCSTDYCDIVDKIIVVNDYTTDNILMKLSTLYTIDKSISYMGINNASDIIGKFGSITYTINNKTYITNLNNRTPNDYQGTDAYFEIPTRVQNASYIALILNIRNKEYKYVLRST